MVKYTSIINTIEEYVEKCHDYPKANAIRNFDPDNFIEEVYYDGTEKNRIPSPQGHLQRTQEELQKNVNYTNLEIGTMHDYQTNSYIALNYWLNGGELPTNRRSPMMMDIGFWMGYIRGEDGELISGEGEGEFVMAVHNYTGGWRSKEGHEYIDLSIPQEDELLHRAIDKTPPLQQDTVLYRYGELPDGLSVGSHSVIKGYGSTSFNDYVPQDIMNNGAWVQEEKDRRFNIKVYAPKGTKGVVFNRESSGLPAWQSEFLLDKGQRYFVHSIDYENMTAEIVLY